MYTPSSLYPIISRVAAVVLLVAGSLKIHELLTTTELEPQWAIIFLTAFELLLSAWLLIGLYPRWTRVVAVGCFAVFLNVALARALEGLPSCGCFGKVPVRPWVAVALDSLMIIALVLSPVSHLGEGIGQPSRIRCIFFVVSAFLTLFALSWPLAEKLNKGSTHISSRDDAEMPVGVDAAALERVIQGVKRNHAALHTLVYTTEKVLIEHPVKHKWPRPVRNGKRTGKESMAVSEQEPVEKISRHSYKCWIRGDEIREDCLTHYDDGKGGEYLVGSKGKRIQYAPEIRQAWLSTAEVPDEGLLEPTDLRCAGFHPPLKSIEDWLKACEVLNVGQMKDRTGHEIVRMHVLAPTRRNYKDDVTADFAPAMNYMPSRVVYRFNQEGGVFTVTDIQYKRVNSVPAWFPQVVTSRSFYRDTTSDPDSDTGQNISSRISVRLLAVGTGVRDEDFDPIIPAKTVLLGNLRAQSSSGSVPTRASKLLRETPLTATPKPQARSQDHRFHPWSIAVGMDVLLLGLCIGFRKRLMF